MNTKTEILPEIKIERLCAKSEALPDTPPREKKERLLPIPVAAAAALLIAVSLIFHAALVAACVTYLEDGRAEELLMSAVMPGFERGEAAASGTDAKEAFPPALPDAESGNASGEESTAEPAPKAVRLSDRDLSAGGDGLSLYNETSYAPDISALLSSKAVLPAQSVSASDGASPLVLIIHTHGTEAYSECASSGFRSDSPEKTVVAVGNAMSAALEELGISTIHLETMFDAEDWSTAYDRSSAAAAEVLKKYPSVRYIFDVHRDCIETDSGEYVRSLASFGGLDCAQLMSVCGTDEGGSSHTGWQKNLTFALRLQTSVTAAAPGVMRPINLKSASFYQNLSDGSLLLEAGTCGNTLTEAKRSAVLFAASLAGYINGTESGTDRAALLEKLCG